MCRRTLITVAALAAICLVPATAAAVTPGPNGRIAFTSNRDGNLEIYTMNVNGSSVTRLTNNAAQDYRPAWSPNGAKIAFVSTRDGNNEIYAMNADGTGVTRLTNNAASDFRPSWSPDGSKIVFTTNRDGNNEIYTMNANGASPTNFSNHSGADDRNPAWSPDNNWIIYESDLFGGRRLFIETPNQSSTFSFTSSEAFDANWAPDTSTARAVYDANAGGGIYDIYTAPVSTSGTETDLTNTPGRSEFDPAWSPAGTRVAYDTSNDANSDIYVMNANGSGQTNITNSSAFDIQPDWQPGFYDVPQSATQLRLSLVPNYRQTISTTQCSARGGAPSTHGTPLNLPSCNPPAFAPGTTAHIGTQGGGTVFLTGVSNDLVIDLDLPDVHSGSRTGPDYDIGTNDISVVFRLRISDTRNCSPAPCSPADEAGATVTDLELRANGACEPTSNQTFGSICSVHTSYNAIEPGAIVGTRRTVVQAFRARVNDAGQNGILGDFDDRAFAQQGFFVP